MMTPEQMLAASLRTVREKFDAGDDDWRYSLMRVFREYCTAIAIDRNLVDPIQMMVFEAAEDAFRDRRKAAGKPSNATKPVRKSAPLVTAAAAVTVLRKHYRSTDEAGRAVARATGLEWKQIREFRREVTKRNGKASEAGKSGYAQCVEKIRKWPVSDVLPGVCDIARFGK